MRQARALRGAAGDDGRVFYGVKAFANVAVLRLLREEGIGADVASAGELAFARAAGLTGAELVVHGNNKDDALSERGGGPGRARRPGRSGRVRARCGRRRPARARAGDPRRGRRHARGDRDGSSRIEVRPAPRAGAAARRPRARAGPRRAGPPRPRRLAAAGLHRAGRDDPPARRVRRRLPRQLGWEARVADLGGGFGIRHHPTTRCRTPSSSRERLEAAARDAFASPRSPAAGGLARAGAVSRRSGRRHALPRRCRQASREPNVGRRRRRDVRQPPAAALRRPLLGAERRPGRRGA